MSKSKAAGALFAVSLGLGLFGYPQASWGQHRTDAQVKVIYNYTPFSVIGRKKAGFLCAPNGKLVWSDIAPPVPAMMNSIMEKVVLNEIQKNGLDMGNTQITAYVAAVEFSLCAKNWAFGEQDIFKGRGTLAVEWKFTGHNSVWNDGLANTHSIVELDGTKPPLEAAFE
ncbi:MAG TPA: hypothetical protein VJS46_14140, partial [Rhizorhapis sp.]|nr:hypothetical protein [Rhizorhapis sp.]